MTGDDHLAPVRRVDADEKATLREDEEGGCFSSEVATENAALAGDGYFKVPRVIER